MKRLTHIALCLLITSLISCDFMGHRVRGNGHVTTESRTVGSASRIDVLGSIDVELTQGPLSVRVTADDNLLDYILVEENDGWLKIKTRNGYNLDTDNDIKVMIATPSLEDVRISGSGNVTSNSKFTSDDKMTFRTAGSGNLTLAINSPEVTASIAGSGNINLSGETRDENVSITGSGNFTGDELKSENASVKITGSGDISVYADVKLDAKITGSGGIKYRGNASVSQHIVGSGSVTKME